ncbi:MAG: protease pro-enzyme activation domain-containing protein [Candidatus Bathyarchaeia archaeon]
MHFTRISILILVLGFLALGSVPGSTGNALVQIDSASVNQPNSTPCLAVTSADTATNQSAPVQANMTIPGTVIPEVVSGKAAYVGHLSESATIRLEVVFKIRNLNGFNACLQSINNPSSPNYERFLNASTILPYAPTPGEKNSVKSFLTRRGFIVSDGPSPLVLIASADIKTVEATLGVRMNSYRRTNGVAFFSPHSDPKIPANLASFVNGITGLDNYTRPIPSETPCSGNYCPQGIQIGYSISNLINAGYGGTGKTVAVVGIAGEPNLQTAINTYVSTYTYLPSVTLNIQYPDGTPWLGIYDTSWASENAMDVEAVHTSSPNAGIVVVYIPPQFLTHTYDLMDGVDYVASQHLASIVSNSWSYRCGSGPCSDTQLPANTVSNEHSRLAFDAAQGLTILFASGDEGAKPDGTNLGTEFPASDPNVLAVGATNLVLAGCGTTTCTGYGSETGGLLGGGGISGYFSEPSWQVSNIGLKPGSCPSGYCRAVPDVSMLGYAHGIWVYSTVSTATNTNPKACGTSTGAAGWYGCTGTSLATPLWAGFLADALQKRGNSEFGIIDPTIYQIGNSPSYSVNFHDITTGSNGYYNAGAKWDAVTGWGSPIGNNLAAALSVKTVSTDKSTYTQGDTIHYTGSGFTANGQVQACLTTTPSSVTCTSEPNADSSGNVAGSFAIDLNWPTGPQQFWVYDVSTNTNSNSIQLTILELTLTATQTTTTTSTYISSTTSSTTSTTKTSTKTTTTSVSTSTAYEVCSATSTTSTTSVIIQAATVTTSTTSTTTTGTSTTSTFSTTSSMTGTSTSTTVTTTTITLCSQTTTSTSTSVTLTTFTRPPTSISLTSPSSATVGSSVTLSGSILPNPGAVQVVISLSSDSGSTWNILMIVTADNSGSYSASWTPSYRGSYLLESSWGGNNQLAGSTSSPDSLTVNGVITPTPTLLLTSPATATRGQTLRLQITLFNPTSMPLNANVTIQIIGPGNYVTFDVIQVKVTANSESTGYYDWTVPNQSGVYTVTVELLSPKPSAFDTTTIQVL